MWLVAEDLGGGETFMMVGDDNSAILYPAARGGQAGSHTR